MQGRSVSGRGSHTIASCLSRCARPGLSHKRTRYGKLMQSKSGQAPKEMTESRNWIQDKFLFQKLHIRCKGSQCILCFSTHHQRFNRPGQDQSDPTIQPSVTSPSTVSARSSVNQQVMDQFTDENHAVIIPRAKERDNKNNLLQLPFVGAEGLRR